jgi:hypothetical protein
MYGSDPFAYDFAAALDACTKPHRDPMVSYGIPPKLAARFQRTGQGPMFNPPSRVKPGGKIVESAPPTLEKLVKHAQRFGVECVYETAQQHLTDGELRSLDAELSRIDRKRRRVFPDDATSELDTEIVRLAETLPVAQVAVQVGKSTSYIYSVLRMATEAGADRSI